MTKDEFANRLFKVLEIEDQGNKNFIGEIATRFAELLGVKFDLPFKPKTRGEEIAEKFARHDGDGRIEIPAGEGGNYFRFQTLAIGETRSAVSMMNHYVAVLVDRAIAEEREACAKIAEAVTSDARTWVLADGRNFNARFPELVSEAIRTRK